MDEQDWLDQLLFRGAQKVLPTAFSARDDVNRLTGIEKPKLGLAMMNRREGAC